MPPSLTELIVGLAETYAAIGAVFACAFVSRGVSRIDPMAHRAPWSFRILIAPGAAVFWPLLLMRWAAGAVAPPVEVNAHRRAAR